MLLRIKYILCCLILVEAIRVRDKLSHPLIVRSLFYLQDSSVRITGTCLCSFSWSAPCSYVDVWWGLRFVNVVFSVSFYILCIIKWEPIGRICRFIVFTWENIYRVFSVLCLDSSLFFSEGVFGEVHWNKDMSFLISWEVVLVVDV